MKSITTILSTSVHNSRFEKYCIDFGTEISFSCMVSKFSTVISVFTFLKMCYDSDLISIQLYIMLFNLIHY